MILNPGKKYCMCLGKKKVDDNEILNFNGLTYYKT